MSEIITIILKSIKHVLGELINNSKRVSLLNYDTKIINHKKVNKRTATK